MFRAKMRVPLPFIVGLLFMFAGWFDSTIVAADGPQPPANLRCEYLSNPLGIDVKQPRFFWVLDHTERGQKQSAYELLVACDGHESPTNRLKVVTDRVSA